jgi:hypothetical protein
MEALYYKKGETTMELALKLLETTKQLQDHHVLFNFRLWDLAEKAQKRELIYLHDQILDSEIRFVELLTELADKIEDLACEGKLDQILCPKIQKELEALTHDECLEMAGCYSIRMECQVDRDGEYTLYFNFENCPFERRLVLNTYDKNFLNLFLQALTKEDFEAEV